MNFQGLLTTLLLIIISIEIVLIIALSSKPTKQIYKIEDRANKIIAGIIALALIIGFFFILGLLIWRYLFTGDERIFTHILSIWSFLGPIIGSIITYYFKS